MHNLKYHCVDVMTNVIGHISLSVANPSSAQRHLLEAESENIGNGKHLRYHLV